MRRSDFFIKAIAVVLFIAIAAYLGVYLYTSSRNPFQTAAAVTYTVQDSDAADGYIVRDEAVIPGGDGSPVFAVNDGDKVAAGANIATIYSGDDALSRAGQIRTLQLQIQQLEAAQSGTSAADTVAREVQSVTALADAVQHRDFTDLDALSLSIEADIFRSGTGDVSPGQLTQLQSQLGQLQADTSGTTEVNAPQSGIFSKTVDAYENVSPDDLSGLTPDSLTALFSSSSGSGTDVIGKMVYGITWDFAAIVSDDDVTKLVNGNTYEVDFTQPSKFSAQMKVESIGDESSDGKCVVVMSCKENMTQALPLRGVSANVVFSSVTGIRIPKEAVHLDSDNKTFLYLLVGLQAEQKYVDILTEFGDSYIVQGVTSSGTSEVTLNDGAEIIVKANDLYNGKVVQ